jgi:hypothetical protein
MSQNSDLSLCPKAVAHQCTIYDGWEPAKICLTQHGKQCKINKPKVCGQCGYFRGANKPCRELGYFSQHQTKSCNQAVSRKELYSRGY